MKPIIVNPEAERDLSEAKDWYDHRLNGLGTQLIARVTETFLRIQQFPEAFATVFPPLRMLVTEQFPYSVVYRSDPEQITVVAVYHVRRNPRELLKRV